MAHVDYFLKIDGVEGESSDAKHKGEIEVLSWSYSGSQGGTFAGGGGGGAGKVQMNDFHFNAITHKGSTALVLAMASGQHIPKAVLTCRKAGKDQQEYLIITLSDVLVTSYSFGGSQGEVQAMDNVGLNYSKIEIKYAPQKADGTLDAYKPMGWDLKANKKV